MIDKKIIIEKMEEINYKLPTHLNSMVKNISNYINDKKIKITIIASNNKLINEFEDAMKVIKDSFIDAEFINIDNSFISDNSSDEIISEISDKVIFSDTIVILTTALRYAPEKMLKIIDLIKKYNKKTLIYLSGFNQIGYKEENIKRKLAEASREINLSESSIFAASKNKINDIDTLKTYVELIESFIKEISKDILTIKEQQSQNILKKTYKHIYEETLKIKNEYIKIRSSLNEERQIAALTYESLKLIINFSVEFSQYKDLIDRTLDNISWIELKDKIYLKNGEVSNKKSDEYSEIIKNYFEECINNLKKNHENFLESKVINIIEEIRRKTNNNYNSLSKINELNKITLDKLNFYINNIDELSKSKNKIIEFEKEFLVLVHTDAMKIISEKLNNYLYKILSALKKLADNNENEKCESPETENNTANMTESKKEQTSEKNNNLLDEICSFGKSKFKNIIKEAIDKLVEDMIIDISKDINSRVDQIIFEAQNTIINELKDNTEKYFTSIMTLYNKLAEELDSSYMKINNFIKAKMI